MIYFQNKAVVDWGLLRAQGVSLIQLMNAAQEQWTDYNLHDPGITILETLCYAISDLSYRLDFSIEDLLAVDPATHSGVIQSFFTAQQALPNAALTIDDYRRLLIDQDGINNGWVHPLEGQGTYLVFVDTVEGFFAQRAAGEREAAERQILELLNQQRNLCEAFVSAIVLPKVGVNVTLTLDLCDDADAQTVRGDVEKKLGWFFSRSVTTLSFDQMQAKGHAVAEILQGPVPENGFVQQSELDRTAAEFNRSLSGPVFRFQAYDLEACLETIVGVRKAELCSWSLGSEEPQPGESPCPLEIESAVPYFSEATLNLCQKGFWFSADIPECEPLNPRRLASDIDIDYPRGQYRNLNVYSTIQNDLPDYYGVGAAGLMPGASDARKEQAKQLRGYLMLFDQTLCNYFAQLNQVANLLAMQRVPEGSPISQAYFGQKLPDIAWRSDFEDMYTGIACSLKNDSVKKEVSGVNTQQKNKLLDHLLALFSEAYIPFEVYKKICGVDDDIDMNMQYLSAKQSFLNEIVLLRGKRGQINSLRKIIVLKLAIRNDQVEIIDNASQRAAPIPYNEIPFKIPASGQRECFSIEIRLPEKFVYVQDGNNSQVQEFAYQTLLALIPAHIHFTISEYTPGSGQTQVEG